MGRRVWIIPKSKKITNAIRADAELNNCPEIAIGIPPILEGKIGALPCAYEEPDVSTETEPSQSTHIAQLVSIDVGKARPAKVKQVWEEREYFHDCFVTETIKEMYVAGNIQIGDYVLVFFDDRGEQLVTEKIYKSW